MCLALYEDPRFRLAAFVALIVNFAIAPDFDVEVLAQGVYDRYRDPMEPAGDFVCRIVEFPARMEHCHYDRYGRDVFLSVYVHRDAAAVVIHRDGPVQVDLHSYVIAVAGKGFIDAVVYDLVDQVMQTFSRHVSNVHGRAHANRAQSFEDRYLLRWCILPEENWAPCRYFA